MMMRTGVDTFCGVVSGLTTAISCSGRIMCASANSSDERVVGAEATPRKRANERERKNVFRMKPSLRSLFFHVYAFFHENLARKRLTACEKVARVAPWRLYNKQMRYSPKRKRQAHDIIINRINYFNERYQCRINRITVRNQRRRWGSCSRKGNLNFNYRIVRLPLSLVDYIVVHELCHLRELNHSRAFWQLVADTLPDFKERRSALRKVVL